MFCSTITCNVLLLCCISIGDHIDITTPEPPAADREKRKEPFPVCAETMPFSAHMMDHLEVRSGKRPCTGMRMLDVAGCVADLYESLCRVC